MGAGEEHKARPPGGRDLSQLRRGGVETPTWVSSLESMRIRLTSYRGKGLIGGEREI